MAESPKKQQKTPQRYDRLLKGEISAKQYVSPSSRRHGRAARRTVIPAPLDELDPPSSTSAAHWRYGW